MKKSVCIGVTAPSSGLEKIQHELLKAAIRKMEAKSYRVVTGETPWTQGKAKSAHAKKRAKELNDMLQNPEINLVFPPWGGELLIEMLEYVDFSRAGKKWILGYSDVSVLLLAITLKTGIATAHGTNLIDLRGDASDQTTAMWEKVLQTAEGEEIQQFSSEKYQKSWDHESSSPSVFHLTEPTVWKTESGCREEAEGRLLGGCIDVISRLAGTPYGDVTKFRDTYIPGEKVLWYLENCEMSAVELRRALVQMKYAGWFENCSGILFGRSAANTAVEGYTAEDVYREMAEETGAPVFYDIDCGHQPPQITFINGAYGKIIAENGSGRILQRFI
nr:S66 peptidase family protein [Metabacillus kandeliae]